MKKAWLPIALALIMSLFGSLDAHPYPFAQNPPEIEEIDKAITALSKGGYDDAIRAAQSFIGLQTNHDVGLSLFYGPDYPIVKEAFPNGPAERAGIKDADKIIRIGGKSIKGWEGIKIREALRGATGTKVLLTLERIGLSKPIPAAVVRGTSLPREAAKAFGIRSLAYRYKSFREGALDDAERAMALNSGDEWAYLSLAAVFLDSGRLEEALKLLSPHRSVQALLLKATAVFKQGKTQEAAEIFSTIQEEGMPPENAMIAADREALLLLFEPLAAEHRAKARLFELKKQYPEALAELSAALKLAAGTEAEAVRDALFGMVRKIPSALELPEEARKHALRAELQIKDGNFEQAAKEYRMAIRIAPYAARLYYNLALVNETIKNYAEAIRVMKIYLQAVPDAPDARAAKDAIIKWEFEMEKGR